MFLYEKDVFVGNEMPPRRQMRKIYNEILIISNKCAFLTSFVWSFSIQNEKNITEIQKFPVCASLSC